MFNGISHDRSERKATLFEHDGRDLARYELIATAIACRSILVKEALEGEATYCDGEAIYLNRGLDCNRLGFQDELTPVAFQSALLAEGSLDRAIMVQLRGRPSVTRRYLAIEGTRILSKVAQTLPGLPAGVEISSVDPESTSPVESLELALRRRTSLPIPEVFGTIRPHRVLSTKTSPPEVLRADPKPLRGIPSELPELTEDDDAEALGTITRLLMSPLQSPFMNSLFKMIGVGRESGIGRGEGDLSCRGALGITRVGSNGHLSLVPAPLAPLDVPEERGWGWRYPEWDTRLGRYRPAWCTVRELLPRSENAAQWRDPPSDDLSRRLARLGVGLERRRRQLQGDEIDLDAAVESRVDILMGRTPHDGVYIECQRRRRSLAVLILLDVSGSVAEGDATKTSVHVEQRRGAGMLVMALHSLGDRVALYGFRSHGRSAVHLVRVKGFDDAATELTFEQLGGLNPEGYTRLGAAIRHGAHILATKAGTDRRLLLVLSDGFPYDSGYEGTYARADSRRALAEARRQGIGCLCLTLGATTPPTELTSVFGTAAHASASRFEQLNEHLGPLFARALASADRQRRFAQRQRHRYTIPEGGSK